MPWQRTRKGLKENEEILTGQNYLQPKSTVAHAEPGVALAGGGAGQALGLMWPEREEKENRAGKNTHKK